MIANTYSILQKRKVKLEPLFNSEIEVIIDEETTLIFAEADDQITVCVWKLADEEWAPLGEASNIGFSTDSSNSNGLADAIVNIAERYSAVVARQKGAG